SRRISSGTAAPVDGRKKPMTLPRLVTRIGSVALSSVVARSRNSRTVAVFMWSPPCPHAPAPGGARQGSRFRAVSPTAGPDITAGTGTSAGADAPSSGSIRSGAAVNVSPIGARGGGATGRDRHLLLGALR